MIVICTKCQAKFRVADEKIGPRGAKVRCSKCQTVFLVHPDLGTMPLSESASGPRTAAARRVDVDLESHVSPGPAPLDDPFGGQPLASPAPFPERADPAGPSAGPFAPAQADPFVAAFASSSAPPAADPFAAPFPSPADPFAAPEPRADPFAAPPLRDDPFAPRAPAPDAFAPAAADPFQPAAAAPGVPLTDLSDLLGTATPAAVPRPGTVRPAAAGDVGTMQGAEAPRASPAPSDDGGLSLEERTIPPVLPPPLPKPLAASSELGAEGLAGPDSFSATPWLDGGSFEFASPGADEPLALAREPAFVTAAAEKDAPVEAPAMGAPDAAPAPAPAVPPTAVPRRRIAAAPAPDRIPDARASRLRAVAVNAVALAALLLVAVAILVVWRSEGPLDASSLRPAAILAALSRGSAGPFVAQEIRSGTYERERGPPILFVRGKVVSRAESPVRAVRVAVEVVRRGEVIARGEAVAGAVPTAEELWRSVDAAAIATLARAAASRAPRQVRPGDAVPFLVAIPDHPADLDGAAVRVEVAPAAGVAP